MKASYKKFEELLESKNLTPYKIHKMTGIATSTLSDWKNGKSTPKTDKLAKIADVLDVPITYFYEDIKLTNQTDVEKFVNIFSGVGGIQLALPNHSFTVHYEIEPEVHMHSKLAYDLVKEVAKMKDTDVSLLLDMAKRLNPDDKKDDTKVVPFPQYPNVTMEDIRSFAARNAKRDFTDEEIAEIIYEKRKED